MSPMEQKELTDIVSGMTNEELKIIVTQIPDNILVNELINRYVTNRDTLAQVRKVAGA